MELPQEFPLGIDPTAAKEYQAKTLVYIQTALGLFEQQGEETFDKMVRQHGAHPVLKGLFNKLFPENEFQT